MRRELEAGELPKQVLEAAEGGRGFDAEALDHLLVEVVKELLVPVGLRVADLALQLLLELVELEADLLRSPAPLVNVENALLEVDAGLDGTQHLLARAEDALEELELLGKKQIDADVGGVSLVEEVDHDDIELLAVAVAAADALLDPLRVPGQIVVDDQIAELEVDALGGALQLNCPA